MTTGQRIAAKRKELELSQEALGAELGVSRQTIYKWESDASLPEIDKLVALSRRFQVPVGWLLGVEEAAPAPGAAEFSEEQLRLLENLLARYRQVEGEQLNQAQREQVEALVGQRLEAARRPKRRWPWVLAAIVLIFACYNVKDSINQVNQSYSDLQRSVNFQSQQYQAITDRVEEILKAQNTLTADYGTELLSVDPATGTATFSVRAVPKTYTPGMSVVFLADSGDGVTEQAGAEGENGSFFARLTCPLTNDILISAVFVMGDTRQTQLLDQYGGLYGDTLPAVELSGFETCLQDTEASADGTVTLPESIGWIRADSASTAMSWWNTEVPRAEIQTLQVGLFVNQRLLRWLEPCEKPEDWGTDEDASYYRLREMKWNGEEGDRLVFAALVTDEYGRRTLTASGPSFQYKGGVIDWYDGDEDLPYQETELSGWVFS